MLAAYGNHWGSWCRMMPMSSGSRLFKQNRAARGNCTLRGWQHCGAGSFVLLGPQTAPCTLSELFWCWERVRARGEGGNTWWDGWMASLTQWTWVWADSGRQWRTGKPGVLQSMGSQTVRHNLATEQQQIYFRPFFKKVVKLRSD